MLELESAEFFSMVTPVHQLHVRPNMGYTLTYDEYAACVVISGKAGEPKVYVPASNVKHMVAKVKNVSVQETPVKKPTKTRAPKRTQKKKVKDPGLVKE